MFQNAKSFGLHQVLGRSEAAAGDGERRGPERRQTGGASQMPQPWPDGEKPRVLMGKPWENHRKTCRKVMVLPSGNG